MPRSSKMCKSSISSSVTLGLWLLSSCDCMSLLSMYCIVANILSFFNVIGSFVGFSILHTAFPSFGQTNERATEKVCFMEQLFGAISPVPVNGSLQYAFVNVSERGCRVHESSNMIVALPCSCSLTKFKTMLLLKNDTVSEL